MKRDYEDKLSQYVEQHPGEWVLYAGSIADVSFLPSKEAVLGKLKTYGYVVDGTAFFERIPKRMPRENVVPKNSLLDKLIKLTSFEMSRRTDEFEKNSRNAGKVLRVMADARDGL